MEEQKISKKGLFALVLSLCFATFMAKLDTYVVNIALPTISREFNITTSQVSLVVLYFLLFTTSSMMIFGKWADKTSVKNIFMWGYLVFIASSFSCGISHNLNMLLISRSVQGIGASMLMISVFALVPRLMPKEYTGWAFGILSTTTALAILVGAPLGGFITGYSDWHWIFLLNVPIGIIAVIYAHKVIPNDSFRSAEKPRSDILGALTSFFAILLFMFALNKGKEIGWTSVKILGSFASSIVLLIAFVLIERRAKSPLLNINLFKIPGFISQVLLAMIMYMFISGNNFIMPFFLEIQTGLKPQGVGYVLLIFSVVFIIISPRAGKLSDKIKPAYLCAAGLLLAMINTLIFSGTMHLKGLLYPVIFVIINAVAMAFFMSPNNNLIMSIPPESEKGTTSGIYNMLTNLSMVMGVTVFETIFSESIPNFKKSIFETNIDPGLTIKAFTNVYLFGALLFMTGVILSFIELKKNKFLHGRQTCY